MNINFPSVDETYIKTKVRSGFYSNATELIRDAVRRMREQDEQRTRLFTAIKIGEEDIAAGRYKLYTPKLQSEIIENAKKKAAEGRKPKRDVTP
jgi:antitoxin ParD1/3/4